jgi:hypothetical protein
MTININDTQLLLAALEQTFLPQTLLRDTFFPNPVTFPTKEVLMDYRKGNRVLAPFVTKSGGNVNVERTGYSTKSYEPPMMSPSRPLTIKDIENRAFGENIFSARTPQQRALEIIAKDLADLVDMNTRRVEWMAAQLMLYGEFDVAGYADDGKTQVIDTVSYSDWTQKLTLSGNDLWSATTTADPYSNLEEMSQTIARNSGRIPGIAIMSYATKNKFLDNAKIKEVLLIPSRDNLTLMSLAPRITSPGVVRIGFIESLNLELYAYDGIYQDDSGNIQQYIPDGYVIMGVSGRGSQLFGAITQLEGPDGSDNFLTYEGKNVPKIWSEKGKDTRMLRVASKCVLKPEFIDDWYTLKAF